ncbi:hypothetical protein [Massilia phosphatilytica]
MFSNGELLKSRIHDHKRMQTRRVAVVPRVAYGTGDGPAGPHPADHPRDRHEQGKRSTSNAPISSTGASGRWISRSCTTTAAPITSWQQLDAQQAIFLEIYRRFQGRRPSSSRTRLSIVRLADAGLCGTFRRNGECLPPPARPFQLNPLHQNSQTHPTSQP